MKLYNTIITFIFPSTTTTPHFNCFPPAPPHFCFFSPPPPPPHFYCFHSSTTTTTTITTATTFLLFSSTTSITATTSLLFSLHHHHHRHISIAFVLHHNHHHHHRHHISIASILRPLVSFFSPPDSIKDCQLPSLVHFVAMSRVANNNRGFLQLLADCPIVSSLGSLVH